MQLRDTGVCGSKRSWQSQKRQAPLYGPSEKKHALFNMVVCPRGVVNTVVVLMLVLAILLLVGEVRKGLPSKRKKALVVWMLQMFFPSDLAWVSALFADPNTIFP